MTYEYVNFNDPLWVLFSSGTTGKPKPIVQSQGGILLEHLKALTFHADLSKGDRFFWFTTTGWMMWNFLVGGLLTGSTIILYDGNPGYPDKRCCGNSPRTQNDLVRNKCQLYYRLHEGRTGARQRVRFDPS